MKKILIPALLILAAGCVTPPEPLPAGDPTRYDDYGEAMKSDPAQPMAYEWQCAHAAEIAAAVKPEVLSTFLVSEAAAAKLLAQVGPAYTTDPLVMTRIGAITQLVMTPGCAKAAAARPVWVAALKAAEASAPDAYRRAIFRDQLNWCE